MKKTTVIPLLVLVVLMTVSGIGYRYALDFDADIYRLGYVALFYMPTPLYSLLIAKYLFKVKVDFGSFLSFKDISIKKYLLVLKIFLTWIVIMLGLTAILTLINPDIFGELITAEEDLLTKMTQLVGEATASSGDLPPIPLLIPISIIGGIIAGTSINMLFALSEEVLWRGHLFKELAFKSFYKKHLIIGLLWGLWHIPLIAQGYNYGADKVVLGSLLFVPFCMAFSIIFGHIAEKTQNVMYSGILHGMFNGSASLFIIILIGDNPLISGPVGLVSLASILLTWLIVQKFSTGEVERS